MTTTNSTSEEQPMLHIPPGYVGPLHPSSWTDHDKRTYATTHAQKRQRGRTVEFEQAWMQCWKYFANTLSKGRVRITAKNGAVCVKWDNAALLYNFFLRKAHARGEMRFRLSDAKLNRPKVIAVSGLKRRENMKDAEDVLIATGLIRITDRRGNNGDDYTVELLRPPRKGISGQSFVSAWDQPHVSKVDPRFHWRDTSLDDDKEILTECSRIEP